MTKNIGEKTAKDRCSRDLEIESRASRGREDGRSWTTKEERQKTQSRSISDNEVARYSGPDVSAPSVSGLNELIEEMLIRKSIEPIASLMTPSKKRAADAAARPKIVSASASQKKAVAGMRE